MALEIFFSKDHEPVVGVADKAQQAHEPVVGVAYKPIKPTNRS